MKHFRTKFAGKLKQVGNYILALNCFVMPSKRLVQFCKVIFGAVFGSKQSLIMQKIDQNIDP
jgi:hypothetical protein